MLVKSEASRTACRYCNPQSDDGVDSDDDNIGIVGADFFLSKHKKKNRIKADIRNIFLLTMKYSMKGFTLSNS